MAENCNECVIEWIRGRDYVGITASAGSRWKGRVEKLAEKFPDDVKILERNKDGSIFAHAPYRYIKINPPKKYSEETREKMSERMRNMSKWKVTDVEEMPDFDFDDEDEEILNGEDKIGF